MAQADAKKHCQGHSTKFRQALPGNTSIGVKTFTNLDLIVLGNIKKRVRLEKQMNKSVRPKITEPDGFPVGASTDDPGKLCQRQILWGKAR